MTKLDRLGSTIAVKNTGLVRIDQMAAFVLEWRNGEPWLRFCDRDRQRCELRGDKCVSVPLDVLMSRLIKECEKRWST